MVIAVVVIGALGGRRGRQSQEEAAAPAARRPTSPPLRRPSRTSATRPRHRATRRAAHDREVDLPAAEPATEEVVEEAPTAPAAPEIEVPEPTAGRLVRLRARLSRSQNALGKGPLTLLSREHLDEDTWEESRTPCSPPTSVCSPPRSWSRTCASA
ncbi:hypothetical protein [Streptomyces sp. KL116D]|uniref:hypothetical protein n=1 Tax=Streptomyces sp. KL116D TaxID=3045152 RepID=UPI003557E887